MELEQLWSQLREAKAKVADLALHEEHRPLATTLIELLDQCDEIVLSKVQAQHASEAPIAVFNITLAPQHNEFLARVDRETKEVRAVLRMGKNVAVIASLAELLQVRAMLEKETPQTPHLKQGVERLKGKVEAMIADITATS